MPARLAGRGEAAVGISFSHDIVAAIEDGLTDLKVVFPSEGTGYEVGGMALVKNAPQPELGRRFMDWAISEEAQEMGPIFTAYQIPTNPDAKVPQKSAKLSSIKMIDYDFAWSGASREALVTRFTTTIMPPPMQINVAPQNR
jgi:iron(III) transport system substrate-binding protein